MVETHMQAQLNRAELHAHELSRLAGAGGGLEFRLFLLAHLTQVPPWKLCC
jgi:hypothetical protein